MALTTELTFIIFIYRNISINMAKHLIKVFKALSDPTRIEIVQKLASIDEFSCQELIKQFPLAQPTLSHHFNKLIDAKILSARKDGVSHFYKINKKYLGSIGINIDKMTKEAK